MADQASITHPHRPKMDGSSDLICLNCLGTITTKHGADKSDIYQNHICHTSFSARRSPNQQQTTWSDGSWGRS
jgi:hypothetical protein